MHLLALHEHGSSNPLGVSGNTDRLPFHPYFTFKDLVTFFVFLLALSLIVFYAPNLLGHSDNYIQANPMVTPSSIVPEWYLLPYYAILRSIPNKLHIKVCNLTSCLDCPYSSLTTHFPYKGLLLSLAAHLPSASLFRVTVPKEPKNPLAGHVL